MRVRRTASALTPLCPGKSVTRDPHTARPARPVSLIQTHGPPRDWRPRTGLTGPPPAPGFALRTERRAEGS